MPRQTFAACAVCAIEEKRSEMTAVDFNPG
jgi:hypothetical protein